MPVTDEKSLEQVVAEVAKLGHGDEYAAGPACAPGVDAPHVSTCRCRLNGYGSSSRVTTQAAMMCCVQNTLVNSRTCSRALALHLIDVLDGD